MSIVYRSNSTTCTTFPSRVRNPELSDYDFKNTIGTGNFGKVTLAIYKPTNEKVAIKILNKERIKSKNEMHLVNRELNIIKNFTHINVIKVHHIKEDHNNFYIIMEYCELGELFDYIVNRKRLSEDESAMYFHQLINGVEHIHANNVVHRDLKPENLLLTHNKILKIIDFGLSSVADNNTMLSTKCGSPSYAAPEIIRGSHYDGYKTDIWCCGIILYAMVCGYLPFEGEDNAELFNNILKGNLEFPHFVKDECKEVIERLLMLDPLQRSSIDDIKQMSFYIKGGKLCGKEYYRTISEMKRCNSVNGCCRIGQSNSNTNSNSHSTSNIKLKIKKKIKGLKIGNSNSNNNVLAFKQRIKAYGKGEVNYKRSDTLTNRINTIFKTENIKNGNNKHNMNKIVALLSPRHSKLNIFTNNYNSNNNINSSNSNNASKHLNYYSNNNIGVTIGNTVRNKVNLSIKRNGVSNSKQGEFRNSKRLEPLTMNLKPLTVQKEGYVGNSTSANGVVVNGKEKEGNEVTHIVYKKYKPKFTLKQLIQEKNLTGFKDGTVFKYHNNSNSNNNGQLRLTTNFKSYLIK